MNAAFNVKAIENDIRALTQTLSKLAPHPTKGQSAFIALNDAFKPAADYEGMVGNMLIDGFLGEVFNDTAANDNVFSNIINSIDYNMLEMAAHYADEIGKDAGKDHKDDKTHNNFGRGRGSVALYERRSTQDIFKRHAAYPKTGSYLRDLKARYMIEQSIAMLTHELNAENLNAALELAA